MKSFKAYYRQMLKEGGAFGDLSHPFDVNSFKFSDLQNIIIDTLKGKLDYVEEKTDGHNLMLTVRDGRLLAARNKGHLKNRGETALDVDGIASKFAGRGNAEAYTKAMNDLKTSLDSLSDKQIEKIFQNGENWMSVEVIMPVNAENIIKYGTTELRLHGTIKHNIDGEAIDNINKENARMLDGMLKQKGVERQETFHIQKLDRIDLPERKDFDKISAKYLGELKKIMKKLGAKPNSTMREVKLNYFNALINKVDKKNNIPQDLRNELLVRWVDFETGVNLRILKKRLPEETVKGISDIEKNKGAHHKEITLPLELLFLKLGAEVLKLMSSFMAVSPNDAISNLKKEVDSVSDKVLKSNDPNLKDKLEYELDRLNKIGGWDAVIPSEGVTFLYKGELLKLTGTFAPINQLVGLKFRIKDN